MILDELGALLETAGVAVQDVDLFLGSMDEQPDRQLVIYEYGGGRPEYVQNSFFPNCEMVAIQVVARDKEYQDARLLAARAWEVLAVVTNADLSGVRYRSIRPHNSPAVLKRDDNDRVLIFFNATVEKEVSIASVS